MRDSLRAVIPIVCIMLACLLTGAVASATLSTGLLSASVKAQEPGPILTWQTLVNGARLDEGLAPYGFSSLLTAAAQRHADDVAAHGFTDPDDVHLGSDGTHEQQRIAETGYAAWSWNGENLTVDENLWSEQGTIEDALAFFLDDPVHRDNILSPVHREIGIGVATDADGRSYYVLNFGARPNVLPISINEGAASTDNSEIAIRLTNEEARPDGAGGNFMGRAIEVRISNDPEFDDLPWQPWAPFVPWTLPDTSGEHTVYVQFRDAANRTAASTDSIILDEGTPTTPTPLPPSPTLEPTATPSPTSSPPAPTPSPPLPSPSPSAPTPSPLAPTITPFPTWTPIPTTPPPDSGDHAALLGAVAALQGLALIFGLYLILRRGRATKKDPHLYTN